MLEDSTPTARSPKTRLGDAGINKYNDQGVDPFIDILDHPPTPTYPSLRQRQEFNHKMGRYKPKWIEINILIRDQLSFQTWLLIGALLQSLLVHFLRPPYSFLPAILCFAYVSITYLLESFNILSSSTAPPVNFGRFTAQPPAPDRGVTVFLLGFQSSHPLRLTAPGTKEIGEHFGRIFDQAEKNPESGLLGRTGQLLDMGSEGGNGMFTISYWETEEKLKAWHNGKAHSDGMKWYYSNKAKYPYLGEFG